MLDSDASVAGLRVSSQFFVEAHSVARLHLVEGVFETIPEACVVSKAESLTVLELYVLPLRQLVILEIMEVEAGNPLRDIGIVNA